MKKTRVHAQDVWKPNIILFNSDDGEFKSYVQGIKSNKDNYNSAGYNDRNECRSKLQWKS